MRSTTKRRKPGKSRPSFGPRLESRAGIEVVVIVSQTNSQKVIRPMSLPHRLRNKPLRHARRARRPQKEARCRPDLELPEDRTVPRPFLVSTVADRGAGRPRQVVLDANAHATPGGRRRPTGKELP